MSVKTCAAKATMAAGLRVGALAATAMSLIMSSMVSSVSLAAGSEAGSSNGIPKEEVSQLSNANFEALTSTIEALVKNPALGNCGARMVRVKVGDLGDQIIENAMNEYMADLEDKNGWGYDFGILMTTAGDEASVSKSVMALAPDDAADSLKAELAQLGVQSSRALAASQRAEFKSGTAIYKKSEAGLATLEETLLVRALVDKQANEFLLFTVGSCKATN